MKTLSVLSGALALLSFSVEVCSWFSAGTCCFCVDWYRHPQGVCFLIFARLFHHQLTSHWATFEQSSGLPSPSTIPNSNSRQQTFMPLKFDYVSSWAQLLPNVRQTWERPDLGATFPGWMPWYVAPPRISPYSTSPFTLSSSAPISFHSVSVALWSISAPNDCSYRYLTIYSFLFREPRSMP